MINTGQLVVRAAGSGRGRRAVMVFGLPAVILLGGLSALLLRLRAVRRLEALVLACIGADVAGVLRSSVSRKRRVRPAGQVLRPASRFRW
ncbi:hypothetical protein [Catenulispora rubra]|uniref:hypothetical protein n=1 Tax=Catenulispora rubra TaxID=280293 RepID=UPI00189255C5|nr:hypothetical protein [Catenulispora rubra]